MPEYLFAVACGHEPASTHLCLTLPDDVTAVRHARRIGAEFPEASAVTIACEERVVARAPVNAEAADHSAAKRVRDSEILIAKSRQLLEPTSRNLKPTASKN